MTGKFVKYDKIDTRLLRLIDVGHLGMIFLDAGYKVLHSNSGAERLAGCDSGTMQTKLFTDLVHLSHRDEVQKVLDEISRVPLLSRTITFQGQRVDGKISWLKGTFTNMLEDKDCLCIVCALSDITPEKYSNILLNQTIRKLSDYKYALDSSAIVAITDQTGIINYVNDNFCRISKYTEKELIGTTYELIRSSQPDSSFHPKLHELVSSGSVWHGEVRKTAKDGSFYWLDMSIVPLMDADHRPYQFMAIGADITDRKLNETRVEEAHEEIAAKTRQIDNLLDNIAEGFIALDSEMRYIFANKQIGRILGMSPASLIGRKMWDVFPEAVGSNTYHAIQKAINEQVAVTNEDYYAPLELWQENRIYPSDGGLSVFIRDITRRKQQELQKTLLADIRRLFTGNKDLESTLILALEYILAGGGFQMGECWLVSTDKKTINLAARQSAGKAGEVFFEESRSVRRLDAGQGIPGKVWRSGHTEVWDAVKNDHFVRVDAAINAGLRFIYGIPIKSNREVIGVLAFASGTGQQVADEKLHWLEEIGTNIGPEIKRTQIEFELSQIFNYAPDIICIAGRDGYLKKVNPATSAITGYSEKELINKPLSEFIAPGERRRAMAEMARLFTKNESFTSENKIITKSGKPIYLSWSAAPSADTDLLYLVAKDITERKELENILNRANELARIGGWEVDLTTNKIQWSDVTREIHEVSPDYEPDMRSGINFYAKGTNRDVITQKIKESIDTGRSWDLELQINTAKDNLKWVRVMGEVEMDSSGKKCTRLYGSFQDIDARKRAELSARQALLERNTILESINDAFFAVDKDWVVTYWNHRAEVVLQTPKDKILNKPLWEVFAGSVGSVSYDTYHRAVETNQMIQFEDFFEPLSRWYEITAYPSESGLSVFFKDITDKRNDLVKLKQLNESLELRTNDLARSNSELEQYAYVASHDLQEPLRMVMNFLDLFERQYRDIVDERGKKYIHFAVDGARRMRQIILDLLEFSRAGRSEDSAEDVDFNDVINNLLLLYRKDIEDHNAVIEVNRLPVLRTYRVLVRQVFQNLISNALKYQAAGNAARIAISVAERDDCYEFSVADNGIGIREEYFEKIFVIFQRLHNKDEYSGTGMGLAITKKIVENLGGRIWVTSQQGQGTTFYFTIPKSTI